MFGGPHSGSRSTMIHTYCGSGIMVFVWRMYREQILNAA
jgi:hypothetical protein